MDLKQKIITVIPLFLIVLSLYIIISLIGNIFTDNIIYDNLIWITPVFCAIILILMVFSFIWSFKDIKKLFFKIDKKTWIILLAIFLVGLSLRTFVAPHVHRILYDEDIYLNIGQNIAREGKAVNCIYGSQEKCIQGEYNKQPNGYPFLMSIVFLFGTSESSAYYATAIISSLTIILVFLISYLLFENEKISLFSTLIFTLTPIAILWAPTTSSDTVFIFFAGLTVFAFLSYFKNSKNNTLLFSFASLAYAIQIRTEGILLVLLVIIMFLFLKKDFFNTARKREFLIILIIFSLLILPLLMHLDSVKEESWGAKGDKLGLEYVNENLKDNGMLFFENTRFPVVFTILSLIGLALRKVWKEKIFLGVWFLLFFVLYLLFYAGGFNYGVDVRYSLNLYMPMAILGGCGAFLIGDNLNKIVKKKWISSGVVALIIIVSFFPFIGFVRSVGFEGADARLANDFIIEKMKNMDDDCWIFTMVPSVVLNNGKNAINARYAQNPKIVNEIFNKTDCVFFYEEYWCSSEPWKSNIAAYFHTNFDLIVYDSVSGTVYGLTKTFTLYYIERRDGNI